MGEKRCWLVRDPRGLYYANHNDVPPVQGFGRHWSSATTPWVPPPGVEDGGIEPAPDGTVYGHKLEPGGGPVDVSEWFPEGGRRCANCGWKRADYVCESPHIGTGRECTDGHLYWKPREQAPTVSGVIMYPNFITTPAIPPGEEGGRTMKKYPVEVWTQDEEGKRVKLLKDAPTFMEAKGPQNARDKVVLAIAKLGASVDDHEIVICTPLK